ncbi:MAG: hypothetical protein MHPSP_002755, partial [Paramarteilia canceri]
MKALSPLYLALDLNTENSLTEASEYFQSKNQSKLLFNNQQCFTLGYYSNKKLMPLSYVDGEWHIDFNVAKSQQKILIKNLSQYQENSFTLLSI